MEEKNVEEKESYKTEIITVAVLITVIIAFIVIFIIPLRYKYPTPQQLCGEGVIYWFEYDNPNADIVSVEIKELKCLADIDELKKYQRFKFYEFTLYYKNGDEINREIWFASIYYHIDRWSSLFKDDLVTYVYDLDVVSEYEDYL